VKPDALALLGIVAIWPLLLVLGLCVWSPTFAFAVDRLVMRCLLSAFPGNGWVLFMAFVAYGGALVVAWRRMN
jgi:hypothetical protein